MKTKSPSAEGLYSYFDLDHFRCHRISECLVMLDHYHGGLILAYQFFQLAPCVDVNIIQGFVPHIQICLLRKACGDEHFFLLPGGEFRHVFFELHSHESHLLQDREE